ncbi:FimB/Mfa2 family fimbrial subunit [Bacteroides thetaiotaomicron]|uniref:FimB/Mfa2 family fimbrial subunit n=1 Tax=Bacteroides thetaiotaomicron TaxID=818 RepID=UPI00232E464B|nr:FimB/Mfa2 family fimbrial subunit [Bacteroides thetaiotaomicron]MDC2006830.1 FimB/Mfa2 family fimbrial subunit [Bacteroides thetaiotaomicron]MDC2020669.1 FimB/Mfa2 family fimbrial subunit [Bacteroides thetaiotaomicron]MDC2024573.1 FimB/Mfa2 family fimbrial subunit [Bacteroides thetaiotaomicron]MDC2029629.1 FimB/Mfa2 family fimbrial subunit [Bacteroides thetaiotaomicron]MDC2060089.1 FimB/Mfa2 family fimbrial subunit [Bacteroides thetaiotaomicron]
MKKQLYILMYGAISALLLASCVKDEVYNTSHPDKGAVSIHVNLPQGMGDYTVEIDGQSVQGSGATIVYPTLLSPGEHNLLMYNHPDGLTIADGIARVNAMADTKSNGNAILPMPGYFYSASTTCTVTADDTVHIELDPLRRMRDLHFELTVAEGDPERIASVEGVLSGIAGTYTLATESPSREPMTTAPTFTRDGNRVTADTRLLGTADEAQILVLTLRFTDGKVQTIENDLTEMLRTFNTDMQTPLKISGTLLTPTAANPGTATITDWQVQEVVDITIK